MPKLLPLSLSSNMKWWITIIAICAALTGQAQDNRFEIGTAMGYDYGVNFEEIGPYEVYASGRTSMISFDAYVRIPISKHLALYPNFIYSIPLRTMPVRNLNGDYLPNGYGFDLPYNQNNPSFYYTEDYPTLSSDAEIWQTSYGAYLTFILVPGFELGSGLFIQNRRTDVYDFYAYDEYYWTNSTGTQWDHYSLWDTYEYNYSSNVTSYKSSRLVAPLILNMSGNWGYFTQGMSVVRWLGVDPYWTFRYTAGISF